MAERRVLPAVLRNYPKTFHGKFWDYKAKKVENHFVVYRRKIEGDPWEFYGKCAVVDGIIFVCYIEGIANDFEGIGTANERNGT